MGRPKGGTNKSHSKEEKLTLVKRVLEGEERLKEKQEFLILKFTNGQSNI